MMRQHLIQLIFLIIVGMVYTKPFENHGGAYIIKYDVKLDVLYGPYYNVQASDDKEFVTAIKAKIFGTGDDKKTHPVFYELNEYGIRPNVEQVESKPPAPLKPGDIRPGPVQFAAPTSPSISANCVASLCGGGLG